MVEGHSLGGTGGTIKEEQILGCKHEYTAQKQSSHLRFGERRVILGRGESSNSGHLSGLSFMENKAEVPLEIPASNFPC